MKLSDLRSAAEIHEQDMRDPEYKREYDRLKFANDVAVRVLAYRTEYGLSQIQFAQMLGMRQPNVARLESGEHEPSVSTLARLSAALGIDFSVDIKPDEVTLRPAPRPRKKPRLSVVGVSKVPVTLKKVAEPKGLGRQGKYTISARAALRPGDAVPPRGDAGRSARSLPAFS
ncbi:MAG: helix-turn-helix domain-containing protein [Trebonia sp.]